MIKGHAMYIIITGHTGWLVSGRNSLITTEADIIDSRGKGLETQGFHVASFAASPFSVLCHRRENWRNKERKKEATKKKESLPC